MNKNFPELMKHTKPKTREVQVQSKMHWNKFTLGFHHLIVVLLESVFYALSEPPFRWDRPILPALSVLLVDLSRNFSPKEKHLIMTVPPFQRQSDVEDIKSIASGQMQHSQPQNLSWDHLDFIVPISQLNSIFSKILLPSFLSYMFILRALPNEYPGC